MSDQKVVKTNSVDSKRKEVQKVVKRKREIESHKCSYDLTSAGKLTADKIPRLEHPPSSDSAVLDNSIHVPDSSGITMQELLTRVHMTKRKGLCSEYESIRIEPPTGTFNNSKMKANCSKNRYGDVLCLDHSRVILPCVGADRSSDYINANFVDGYKQKNAFICTQGPLPNTFVDFWRMVWHTQCHVVVMTTRTKERSGIKCGQYWPNENNVSNNFGGLTVCHNDSIENPDFTETHLILHNSNTKETRQITHLQFTSWPDHGVPQTGPFLNFLFRVRHVQETATKEMASSWLGHPLGPPIVVHCSAGIGRTGTFITVDICLRQLDDVGTVNINETVRKIRSQRAFSIQVSDQYVFCYQAIIEHAQLDGSIPVKKLFSLDDIH